MLWLKLAGAGMLIFCGGGAGCCTLAFWQRRRVFYAELERFLALAAEELSARSQPVGQLLGEAYLRYPFRALRLNGSSPVFPACCTQEEVRLFALAFSQLGSRCREDTLSDLAYYQSCCRSFAALAEENLHKTKSLSVPLGICGGVALAVLMF